MAFYMLFTITLLFAWSYCLSILAHLLINDVRVHTLSPYFELFSAIFLSLLLYFSNPTFLPAYFLFFSALIITIKTDLATFLISRFVSLFLVPLGILASWLDLLPISPLESALSGALGYLFFYLISSIFFWVTKKQGLGEGDGELLAFIGSCTGFLGSWFTILFASVLGSIIGIAIMFYTKRKNQAIPFGPFLAIGAMLFVLCQEYIGRMLA